MEPPDFHVLARVPWRYFVTLTFKRETNIGAQNRMLFAWLREAARKFGVHFHRLLWVCRREQGEKFGRLHLHVLIGGVNVGSVTRKSCFDLMNRWEALGGGIARVTLYDTRLSAGEYLFKTERDGGRVYEESKFDSRRSELMLAHALRGALRRLRMSGRDVTARECV